MIPSFDSFIFHVIPSRVGYFHVICFLRMINYSHMIPLFDSFILGI